MTREEAKMFIQVMPIDMVIDKIYDEFEKTASKCGGCVWYQQNKCQKFGLVTGIVHHCQQFMSKRKD